MPSLTVAPSTAANAAQAAPNWSGLPDGVLTKDDFLYGTQSLGAGQTGNSMLLDFAGLSALPDNAVITGIKFTVTRFEGGLGTDAVKDVQIALMWGGTAKGDNKADTDNVWGTSAVDKEYGGEGDTWNYVDDGGWTVEKLKSETFKGRVRAQNTSGSFPRTASVDYVELTVYFTVPSGNAEANVAIGSGEGFFYEAHI